MQIRFTRKFIVFLLGFVLIQAVHAGVVSRLHVWTDGSIMYSADLNSEFNNIINTVNNLDNDNLSATLNLSPSKISASIAGDGLISTVGVLSVVTDGSTIETSGNALRLKDHGTTTAKIAPMAARSVLANATAASANPTELASSVDGYVLAQSGTTLAFGQVQTAGIANGAVTQAKLGAANYGVSSSSGAFSTSSALPTFVDVTNMSITLTATGRPIVIVAQSDGSTYATPSGIAHIGSSSAINWRILEDGSDVSGVGLIQASSAGSGNVSCSELYFFKAAPSVGSHTYKLQVAATSTKSVQVNQCKLVAYEI